MDTKEREALKNPLKDLKNRLGDLVINLQKAGNQTLDLKGRKQVKKVLLACIFALLTFPVGAQTNEDVQTCVLENLHRINSDAAVYVVYTACRKLHSTDGGIMKKCHVVWLGRSRGFMRAGSAKPENNNQTVRVRLWVNYETQNKDKFLGKMDIRVSFDRTTSATEMARVVREKQSTILRMCD